jgi:hypothetical protein
VDEHRRGGLAAYALFVRPRKRIGMVEVTSIQRIPVFLSSTYEDLTEHRRAVLDVLTRFEAVVKGMEFFGARPGSPKDECLASVRLSKIYIAVIAMRYGSLEAGSQLSLTHLEFKEAERLRLPSLIYLIDEQRQPVLPIHVDTGELASALRDFKAYLKAHYTVSFFTTPEDLALRVSQDLPGLLELVGAPVQASELKRTVDAIPRLSWLAGPRFEFLRSKLGSLAAAFPTDQVLREAMELLILGDRLSAVYLVAKKDSELEPKERLQLQLHRYAAAHPDPYTSRVYDMSEGLRGAIDLCMALEEALRRIAKAGRTRDAGTVDGAA